jgi:hypothetical protein
MIDETRADPRDGAWAVGLLAHAIDATAANGDRLVNEVASLATPGMGKILSRATERLAIVGVGLHPDTDREWWCWIGPVGLREL